MTPALAVLLQQPPPPGWGLAGGLYTPTPAYTSWVWTNSSGSVQSVRSPDNLNNGALITEDGTTNAHYFNVAASVTTVAQPYTHTVYAKRVTGGRNFAIEVINSSFGSTANCSVDLGSGAIMTSSTTGSASGNTVKVTPVGYGWWKVVQKFTFVATAQVNFFYELYNGSTKSYAGDSTSSIAVWGTDLR